MTLLLLIGSSNRIVAEMLQSLASLEPRCCVDFEGRHSAHCPRGLSRVSAACLLPAHLACRSYIRSAGAKAEGLAFLGRPSARLSAPVLVLSQFERRRRLASSFVVGPCLHHHPSSPLRPSFGSPPPCLIARCCPPARRYYPFAPPSLSSSSFSPRASVCSRFSRI